MKIYDTIVDKTLHFGIDVVHLLYSRMEWEASKLVGSRDVFQKIREDAELKLRCW